MPYTTTTVENGTTYTNTFADDGTPLYRTTSYPGGYTAYDYRRASPSDPYELKVRAFTDGGVLKLEELYDSGAIVVSPTSLPTGPGLFTAYNLLRTRYDFDGSQPWSRTVEAYTTNGSIGNERHQSQVWTYNDDKSVLFVWSGSMASGVEAEFRRAYTDANGRPVWQVLTSNDGFAKTGSLHQLYDSYDGARWSMIQTGYDRNDVRLAVTYYNDDKSITAYAYDSANAFAYSTAVAEFDTTGARRSVVYHNDDRTTAVYEYDTGGQASWSSVKSDFDVGGARVATTYRNDDGTTVAYEFDAGGRFGWSQVATYFDQGGNRTKAVYDNDDGTHAAYTFTGGQTTVTYFDASWNVVA